MLNKRFLKPAAGLAVWLPSRGRNVVPEGENIIVDAYVERRITDGDLVEVKTASCHKKFNKKSEVTDVCSVRTNSGK